MDVRKVGRNIQREIADAGYTSVQSFADSSGIPAATVLNTVKGRNTTLSTLGRIADALGMPSAKLLEGCD